MEESRAAAASFPQALQLQPIQTRRRRRGRRRRAPFENNQIETSANNRAGGTAVEMSPRRPNSPPHPRQHRLFSARAFSATKSRSPFGAADDPEQPSTSGQQPATEGTIGQRFSSNRRAHFAIASVEDEFDEEEFGTTADELSDIDDIELGGEWLASVPLGDDDGQKQRPKTMEGQRGELGAGQRTLAAPAEGGRRGMLRQQASLDERGSRMRPTLPQRFQRRRRKEADNLRDLEEGGGGEGKLRVPEGGGEGRAFSPALDIELAEIGQKDAAEGRKESRSSLKSMAAAAAAAILSPRRGKRSSIPFGEGIEEGAEERRKKSSTLNGSIGAGTGISQNMAPAAGGSQFVVPTPPQITITSPLEKPGSAEADKISEGGGGQQQQQPERAKMNPSLIKGLSKSISRFRSRNRVMDADAVEQANFMSKFGMSGTGIQPGDSASANGTGGTGRWLANLVFDTNENYFYQWIALVSTAYVYNLLVVVARTVFVDLAGGRLWMLWLGMDLLMDSIYLADMFVRSRTGYLEQGLLVRDCAKIRALYIRSRQFLWDCASLLPFDHFCWFILWQSQPILRMNRLLRKDRIQRFMEQTETRTSMPNAFRVGVVVWYIAVIIHWNACFYFMISEWIGLGSDPWVYGIQNNQSLPIGINDTLTRRYIYSFYWSTLILTTIGEVPGPQQNVEYAFVTVDLMCGVLIFATIVGNVGSMISNISAGRTDFQNRIDSIKHYMDLRGVGKQLEIRVIKWFDYLWANKQGLTDAQVLKVLPDKLQAEIAMHVHFETLRKVRIFQDCEAGLLAELVLKLQLQVFSPGDYVCRKGDIGREMYIVKRGMLQVVADDGMKVFATLSEGAVFGELSILNIAGSKNGNRRTANVRSVGYTDLFVLNKNDLWIALREYPEARKILINKGRELLRKDNLLDENAPEEQKSAEELSEELQSAVRILQIRIARLLAEQTNTETKLRDRITYLEAKLKKYGQLAIQKEEEEEEEEEEDMEND